MITLGSILFNPPINALPEPKLKIIIEYAAQYVENPYAVIPIDGQIQLTQILNGNQSPILKTLLPTDLEDLKGIACQHMTVKGVNLSLICFQGDSIYHLFIANRSDFPKQKDIDRYSKENKAHYCHAWSTSDQVFILISDYPLRLLAARGYRNKFPPLTKESFMGILS